MICIRQEVKCAVAERNTHESTVAATDLINAFNGNAAVTSTLIDTSINAVHILLSYRRNINAPNLRCKKSLTPVAKMFCISDHSRMNIQTAANISRGFQR
jgi:hypothetical protein